MKIKKNPEMDPERVKLPLVFLGFFVVTSMILVAFTFKSPTEISGLDKDGQDKGDIPEELIVIDQPEEDEPLVQEIPDPDPVVEPSEELETEESRDEDEAIQVTTDPIDIEPDPEPEPEAPIVDYPDKEAEFPGGAAAMLQFLSNNIEYPEIAMELGDQGRVFVEFVVEKDGSITQIKIVRGVSKEIDREAKRVVRMMPSWTPAEQKGESVRARCRIPINFILQ
jgi:protein TonB